MEAMATGLPVVASDIPGNRDLVVEGQTGHLVPVGDRAGFARATLPLLDDPARARTLGQAGQDRIRQHFSVDHMVQRHVALYERILQQ